MLCWIYSRQETSRQIISSNLSQLPPRLSLLLLFWGVRLPRFPLWRLGWAFLPLFIWWHCDTQQADPTVKEWGLPLTARWTPQVTSFCFNKIHRGAGFAKAKGWGQTEQLVPIGSANHGTVGTCYFSLFVLLRGFELLFEHIPQPP